MSSDKFYGVMEIDSNIQPSLDGPFWSSCIRSSGGFDYESLSDEEKKGLITICFATTTDTPWDYAQNPRTFEIPVNNVLAFFAKADPNDKRRSVPKPKEASQALYDFLHEHQNDEDLSVRVSNSHERPRDDVTFEPGTIWDRVTR